jgi:ATP-binding cassette subfamily F protein 3
LRADNVAKAFARPLFAELTFQIERGQRWGVLGPNGTGKTTLLRCLVGQMVPDAGQVSIGTGVRIGYYDQMLSLADDLPVMEAIRPPRKEFNDRQRRDMLARFGVTGDTALQTVASLSGGERSRAALARLASADPNFLVLDEPTNHLDLWARDALERALKNFDGTVLFVSHDRYFVNRVADRLLVVEPGRFRVIDGNYDTYLHLVEAGLAGAATSPGKSATTKAAGGGDKSTATRTDAAGKAGKSKRRFPYRKVAEIEAEIFERESRIEELQQLLTTADVLRSGPRVKEVQAEIAEQQEALAGLYEHWEEASELNW